MSELERRLRQAALTAATQQAPEPADDADEAEEQPRPPRRIDQQAKWVDHQVRQAMERGDFDDLPGAGKPIRGLGGTHDPDWWVKGLIERENITGVLPSAQLRKDDTELDGKLDLEAMEQRVREIVTDFNARVVDARRQLQGGPPIVTPTRDVDEEVRRWQARRAARRSASASPTAATRREPTTSGSRPWWKFW